MIRFIKRWLHRRDIERRLIAYAKTPEGRVYLEAINEHNAIMADWEAEILGAERARYTTVHTQIPDKTWRLLNIP